MRYNTAESKAKSDLSLIEKRIDSAETAEEKEEIS